jgi:hypothetical protein
MKNAILYRSDFANEPDSEGVGQFDRLLESLGIIPDPSYIEMELDVKRVVVSVLADDK